MTKPPALQRAEVLDMLAQRYGKLPREIEEEDVSLLQLVAIVQAGAPDDATG